MVSQFFSDISDIFSQFIFDVLHHLNLCFDLRGRHWQFWKRNVLYPWDILLNRGIFVQCLFSVRILSVDRRKVRFSLLSSRCSFPCFFLVSLFLRWPNLELLANPAELSLNCLCNHHYWCKKLANMKSQNGKTCAKGAILGNKQR